MSSGNHFFIVIWGFPKALIYVSLPFLLYTIPGGSVKNWKAKWNILPGTERLDPKPQQLEKWLNSLKILQSKWPIVLGVGSCEEDKNRKKKPVEKNTLLNHPLIHQSIHSFKKYILMCQTLIRHWDWTVDMIEIVHAIQEFSLVKE